MARDPLALLGLVPPLVVLVVAFDLATGACSFERGPAGDFVARPVDLEPNFERESTALPVELDPGLAGLASAALLLPPQHEGGLSFGSNPAHRYGGFERVSESDLRIWIGRSTGFEGVDTRLGILRRRDGTLECRALTSSFVDVGPPFARAWKGLSGRVRISSLDWRAGSEVIVEIEVASAATKPVTRDEALVRLVMPR